MTTGWRESSLTFKKSIVEKASFILLNHLDLVLTLVAFSLGFTEVNPVMRFLLQAPALLLLFKLLVPIAIAWLVPGRVLLPGIVLLGAVVVWNTKEIITFFL